MQAACDRDLVDSSSSACTCRVVVTSKSCHVPTVDISS